MAFIYETTLNSESEIGQSEDCLAMNYLKHIDLLLIDLNAEYEGHD